MPPMVDTAPQPQEVKLLAGGVVYRLEEVGVLCAFAGLSYLLGQNGKSRPFGFLEIDGVAWLVIDQWFKSSLFWQFGGNVFGRGSMAEMLFDPVTPVVIFLPKQCFAEEVAGCYHLSILYCRRTDADSAPAQYNSMNFEISPKDLSGIFSLYQDKSEESRGAELKFVAGRGGSKYLLHGTHSTNIGLYSHISKGIRKNSIDERSIYYGANTQPPQKVKSFWRLLWEAMSDFTLRILIVAAVLSIILEESLASDDRTRRTNWIEGFSILLAVVICALVSALNNFQKEKQFRKLNEISEDRKVYSVIRESETTTVNQSELVTGDVVIVREGSEVPVDGWLLEAAELYVDESSMTGESEPVPKALLDECLAALKK